jgi:hypothetical protein
VIQGSPPRQSSIQVVGVVKGLVRDADLLPGILDAFRPKAIGLGISAEELESLGTQFTDVPTEPAVPLLTSENIEVRELARFGEVQVPNPGMVRAISWARQRGVVCEALDPSDEEYSEMFTDNIGYFELVRRTLRERRLLRSPPRATSADELVLAWDARLKGRRGSARFASAREAEEVRRISQLVARWGRAVAVVDRERFEGVMTQLAGAVPAK